MPDAKAHALVLERFQFMAITDALEPTWCYVESIDAKKSVSLTDIVSFSRLGIADSKSIIKRLILSLLKP